MEERVSTQRLLALRKLTRSVSELLRDQMRNYLSTLSPLFRPRNVLGNYNQLDVLSEQRGPIMRSIRDSVEANAKPRPEVSTAWGESSDEVGLLPEKTREEELEDLRAAPRYIHVIEEQE